MSERSPRMGIGGLPERLFRSHLTVVVVADSLEHADEMIGSWLDRAEVVISTGTTTEIFEDDDD